MAGFIEGEDRRERLLLPDCLNDYVAEDNLVRVVDVFFDGNRSADTWLRRACRDRATRV